MTTEAHRSGGVPEDELAGAHARLGGGPVAVRSSATAEDLPDASFAGQQETYLNVEAAVAAIDTTEGTGTAEGTGASVTGTGAGKTPGDPRALAAGRREAHERETRRSRVPSVLLSDGTEVETVVPRPPAPGGTLLGVAAAPGRVRGRARVVLDPSRAHLEPGEILVVPTTDPGWPPLFLTAGALVSETGSAVSHGPTVAREYGIPAVVGIRNTTRRITTGQWITVDGAAGTITLDTAAPPRGPGHANASGSPHAPTGRPCGHAAARVGKIGQAPARRR